MAYANDTENNILNHFTGISSWTAPTAIWASLFHVASDDAGAGGTECTGAAYARQSIGIGAANWTLAGNNPATADNDNNIDFPQATADYAVASGDPVQVNLHSLVTAGTLYMVSATFAAVDINNTDTPRIAAGDLDITIE